ncbi:ZIP family metal transporter [Psychroflexus sp. S27]|uniref:ZIP family metal transporter n=1 Tax=Psychroflexus sp. S27 TaxID=1982757 RepID=UPI000C29F44B|nr:ZIP family metal transporter [Psychroflexus sp. S27]PJX25216.1 ZIP family metal transporter [Psychroflexus sp. S27]
MNIILPPIIAVGIGFIAAYFLNKKDFSVNLLLAFSGAFLLSITVLEFLPSIYESENPDVGFYILIGLLLQIILEYLSGGAEHGHLHIDKSKTTFPWVLFVSLCLHSFLEGLPLHHGHHLMYAVIIHKVPVAIIIASFLFKTEMSKGKISFFLILFGLMTPLGAFMQQSFDFISTYSIYFDALVVGIFLHVSTTILFESSKDHKFNLSKFGMILLGIVIALLI